MSDLKWYSGGQSRRKEAITILTDLLTDLTSSPNYSQAKELTTVLFNYRDELIDGASSVPFVLTRLNLEASNIMIKNQITLTKEQSDKLKKLTALSNIRYGY